jgi:hypothetical protein
MDELLDDAYSSPDLGNVTDLYVDGAARAERGRQEVVVFWWLDDRPGRPSET